MTNILPWLIANWLLLCIALAFMIFLIAGVSFALGWYLARWLEHLGDEPKPLPNYPYGDVIKVPDDYWSRVADADHEQAKGRAG